MKDICRLIDWIKTDDPVMCEWIYNYLSKKDKLLPINKKSSNFDEICKYQVRLLKNRREDTKEYRDLINKMRDAWRQQRYRKAHQKKSRIQLNFVLSKQRSKELDFLSKKMKLPRNQTLEFIINQKYKAQQEQLNQLKEEKRKLIMIQKQRELAQIIFDDVPREKFEKVTEERDQLQKKCNELTLQIAQLLSLAEHKRK
jgi:hypothetical protein